MTDPLLNDTVLNFSGIYETSRIAYQGSQSANIVLKTTNTSYNCIPNNGCQSSVSLPIAEREVVTKLPGGQQARTIVQYDGFGSVTGISESDYTTGVTFGTVRTTSIHYYANMVGPWLYDRVASVLVQDGQLNLVAQTSYGYDETTPTASGVTTQHTSVTCPVGAPFSMT